MSAPARTATYLLTGKYQDPSQALGINNPIGAFITDAILDPVNLIGAGLGKKAIRFKPNPEMMYRGLGEEGFKDAIKSGSFRQAGIESGVPKHKDVWYASGNKGFSRAKGFSKDFIAEVPESAFPNASLDKFRGSPGMETRGTSRHIPITEGRILKKDWLRGYKEVPKKKEEGGVIKDDMGQWAHPGEITEIGSPYITMEGVPYPVLGVSDTGDTQMMYPGEDYTFDGDKVTEYPIAQKGITLPTVNIKKEPIYVDDPNDPRLRAYQDSLALHKSINKYPIDLKQPIVAYSKEDAEYLKKIYPKANIQLENERVLDNYEKSTFEEYGRKTKFKAGKKYSVKDLELESNKAEQYRNKVSITPFTKNKGNLITDQKGVPIRSTNISPIALAYGDMSNKNNWNSGLITLYKKPVQPVEYKKPEPKKEPVKETKKEQPKPVERKQNIYEGSPVYSPGTGSGLPSALIGFANQKGDTTYIKPEDYERFAVPKYGKEYIESKTTKKKNGGWLEKYK